MRRLAALAIVLAAAPAAAQPIAAEGVANIVGGDVTAARSRAIADALQQAVAQGGLAIEARTDTVRGVIAADRLTTVASGRLLGHRIVSEGRERDLYRVAVEAEVGTRPPARCAAPTPVHMLTVQVVGDTALDPAVARPLAVRATALVADALARAGVAVADLTADAAGPTDPRFSSDRYEALYRPDPLPTAGRLLAATLYLGRQVAERGAFTGAPGERLNAALTLDLIDAGTRRPLARVGARRGYALTTKLLDLLPLGFQPPQRLAPPDLTALADEAARRIAAVPSCGPLSVAVVGRDRGGLTLGAGAVEGIRPGALLKVGDGEPLDDRGGWTVVEVTSADTHRSTARTVSGRVVTAQAATQLP